MLNVIYGKNASGKTKMLLDMYSECNNSSALTNLRANHKFDTIPFSQERIDIINQELDYQEIHVGSSNRLVSDELSPELLGIIELLCKDIDNIFIDEPDFKLNRNEAGIIVCILETIGKYIKNLWVVTHNECMYNFKQEDAKYWNVIEEPVNNFNLVEVS